MRGCISADEQRMIYRMKNDGLSFRRIARILDCAVTTVETHYRMEKKGIYCKTVDQTRCIDWDKVNTGLMSVRDTTANILKRQAETEQS